VLHPVPFPPIPEDTALAAKKLFGKGNVYIRLGEHINELVSQLHPMAVDIYSKKYAQSNILYTMLVAFQYAEEFTDRQMLDALRNRVDLKYALHLPINFPSLHPDVLCECRKRLRKDPASRETFQTLLDGLTEFGLLKSTQERPSMAIHVINEVCTSNRLEMVVEAMLQALESVATADPEWLRQVSQPHWYVRYRRPARIAFWPSSMEKWKTQTMEIAADIQYFIQQIDRSDLPTTAFPEETQLLRQVWDEQFVQGIDDASRAPVMLWRPTECASCGQEI
jgi:hypothetical protein